MTHLHHLPLSPQRSGPGSVPTAEPCFSGAALAGRITSFAFLENIYL